MKFPIASVFRATSQSYRVKLACGHVIEKPKTDFAREQWYIGKRVECRECK